MSTGWDRAAFRAAYIADGGSRNSARSYISYLNRAEAVLGGLSGWETAGGCALLIKRAEGFPDAAWGGDRNRRDSLSALRKLANVSGRVRYPAGSEATRTSRTEILAKDSVLDLLREAQSLGARYYEATGKPLGVTGEVAEYEAAEKLGLILCDARTPGYDAVDKAGRRIQIKGRAVDPTRRYHGRCPSIKCGGAFDEVLLVLLDRATLSALEIWRAFEPAVEARLSVPGSKARNERRSLGIAQFKSIADCVWKCA